MLFCRSSTVKLGTTVVICRASCVVATMILLPIVIFHASDDLRRSASTAGSNVEVVCGRRQREESPSRCVKFPPTQLEAVRRLSRSLRSGLALWFRRPAMFLRGTGKENGHGTYRCSA